MSQATITQGRQRVFTALLITLGVLILITIARVLSNGPAMTRDARFGEPVFDAVDTLIEQTDRISVTLADESYQLVRTDLGWAMDTTDGYPIRSDRLAKLAEGLQTLTWGDPRTGDPRKHDQIGVGNPNGGGAGALVSFLDTEGTTLTSLITGRRGETIYGRRPDETVAYRMSGDLPPFYSRDAWMDFAVVTIAPETIQMVEIRDRFGDRMVLSRSAGMGPEGFAPAPPYLDYRLLTPLSASGPALALSRFAPVDAKPATSLERPPVAELITVTFDGLEVVARAYDEPDGGYVTLRAVEAGNAAARAESINETAEGWAFKLAGLDYRDMTAPVSMIAVSDSFGP